MYKSIGSTLYNNNMSIEGPNKLPYIHTLEYYSAIEKNEEALFELTRNNLQDKVKQSKE